MPTLTSDANNPYTADTTASILGRRMDYTAEMDTAENLGKMAQSLRRGVNLEFGIGNNAVLSGIHAERFSPEIVARYGFVAYTRVNLSTGEAQTCIGQHAIQCGFSDYAISELTLNPGNSVIFDGGFMYTSHKSGTGKYGQIVVREISHNRKTRKPYTRKSAALPLVPAE